MRRPFPNPSRQSGVALWEVGLVMAVAAAVVVGAALVGRSWQAAANLVADASRLETKVGNLKHAVRAWYGATYCRAEIGDRQRLGFPPQFPLQNTDATLRGYPLPGQEALGGGEAALSWEIAWSPVSVPGGSNCPQRLAAKHRNGTPLRLNVFWSPSENDQPASIIGRRLAVSCDDDNNPQTAESCDDYPADERVVWSSNLMERIDRDYGRNRRYDDWIREYGINCDADGVDCDNDGRPEGDGVMDQLCDSDLDGNFGPTSGSGSGGIDAARFDADADGRLDLDVNGDFAVDRSDWRLLGC